MTKDDCGRCGHRHRGEACFVCDSEGPCLCASFLQRIMPIADKRFSEEENEKLRANQLTPEDKAVLEAASNCTKGWTIQAWDEHPNAQRGSFYELVSAVRAREEKLR